MKLYRVTLADEERSALRTLIASGKYKHTKQKRAQALLATDESEGGKKMNDQHIAHAYDMGVRTVERLRRRFVEDGLSKTVCRRRFRDGPSWQEAGANPRKAL